MLVPAAFTARMLLKISWTMIGARPSEGSSMQRSRGSDTSARESASICCSPPESVPAGCEARSRRRGKLAMARSTRALTFFRSFRYLKPPISRFSRTLSAGKTRRPSGTSAMPAAVRAWAGSRVTSTPSKRILPFLESIDPATPRRVVLLPAPLAPIRLTISPSATSKDRSRTAGTSPYASSRFFTSRSKRPPEVGLDHARVRLHFSRRAFEEPHAVIHDQDTLGDVHNEVHVVLDHDDGRAAFADHGKLFEDKPHFGRVETRGRLVEHEELRPCGERPGNLEHALLTIGKRAGPMGVLVLKTDKGEKIHCLVAESPDPARKKALPQRHVLVDVKAREHVLEQGELLEEADFLEGAGDAEPRALIRRQPDQVGLSEGERARVGLIDAGEEVQQRRLASAVRTDQPEDRPRKDVQGDVVQCAHPAEALIQLFCFEERRHANLFLKASHAWTMPPGMKSTTKVSARP